MMLNPLILSFLSQLQGQMPGNSLLGQATRPTEGIGPRPNPQEGAPSMPASPSQAIFQNYMQTIFDQKYRPRQALGGYQDFGGYGGFMPPQMPGKKKPATPSDPGGSLGGLLGLSNGPTTPGPDWWNNFGGGGG